MSAGRDRWVLATKLATPTGEHALLRIFRDTWPGWFGILCGAIGFYSGALARDDYFRAYLGLSRDGRFRLPALLARRPSPWAPVQHNSMVCCVFLLTPPLPSDAGRGTGCRETGCCRDRNAERAVRRSWTARCAR